MSTLLLGLACGGQTADPSGSEDAMDDDLSGRPPAPHGDAELLATLHEWAARDRSPVAASPQPWERRAMVVADRIRVRDLRPLSSSTSGSRTWKHIAHRRSWYMLRGHSLDADPDGLWRRATRQISTRYNIGTNSGCTRRIGTTSHGSMVTLKHWLGEWSRDTRQACRVRQGGGTRHSAPIRTTTFQAIRGQHGMRCPLSRRMGTSSMSG